MQSHHRKNHATIEDVAARAAVSIATVSRVMNGTAPVSIEPRKRVLAAVEELGFVPQRAARNLASQHTDTIGLIIPEVTSDFFIPMLRGVETTAHAAGFDLLVSIQPAGGSSIRGRRALGEHNSDGLVIFVGEMDDEEIERLARRGFPVVLLYRPAPPHTHIPVVTIENKAGARSIVNHLLEVHGYRRIALLRGPLNSPDAFLREQGYREALIEQGVGVDESLIFMGDFSERVSRRATEVFLQAGVKPQAIFATDDSSAVGSMQALQAAGLRVPEDIAVVGFDDLPFSRYLNPALTTVRAPTEQVGSEAVRLLIELIHEQFAPLETLLPTKLVVRRSCGCTEFKPD